MGFPSLLLLALLSTFPPDAEIRKILADRIDVQKQADAIVVGVIDSSGRRLIAYGGVDGDTLFEIGSATKVFTSLLLADAVQRGEVALTDPVSKFLPAGVKVPERGGKKITLADLATHTSGLPRLPTNFAPKDMSNPYADYTVQQLYDFLSHYELPRDIGAQYEYSNLGAGLLGHALALRAKMSYEALVRTRILDPLKMKSTAITLSDALQKRLAAGHDPRGGIARNWDVPTLAGAGALRSSANDLLEFLSAELGLTKSPLASAMIVQLATRRPSGSPTLEIALGWHIFKMPSGQEIIWHNGGTGGYRSFIAFDAKKKSGVVVLSNRFTEAGVDDIGRHLLDPTAPLLQPPAARKEISVDPKVLESYAGVYELMPNVRFNVTVENGHLFAQLTGQPKFELFPSGEKEFFYKVVDAQITFGDDGLVLHQNGDHPAKRISRQPLVAKERKEIALDAAVLQRYVGKYQVTPSFIITITREDNHLFAQATAQPRFEIFPETERDFFLKVVDAQLTFVTDMAGRVSKAVLHQNGVDQDAKRME